MGKEDYGCQHDQHQHRTCSQLSRLLWLTAALRRHQVSSLSSPPPPPAYNTSAALTGATHILWIDGGFSRFEGTSAENVVGTKGHGVHPVSVALQRAAEDTLETKPPA